MNKIFIMRHSNSIGNEQEIIQGDIDYELSLNGINNLNNLDYSRILKIKNIYSSPSKRTCETSNIIKKKINFKKNIIIDNDLVEKQAGILNGKSKNYLKKYKKEYLDIYLKRGDYDDIPEGENWKYTQARALSFLEKYINKKNECDLIVTHAAFIRMLINTIKFRNRNEAIDVQNACIHEIDNPLDKLNIEKYDIAKTSLVYKIKTYDNTYILKRINNVLSLNDYLLNDLLKYLSKNIIVPIPIYMTNKKDYCIKIYDYIEGKHKLGKLNKKTYKELTNKVYNLSKCLKEYNNSINFRKKDIISELFYFKNYIKDVKYKDLIDYLIKDSELNDYLASAKYILVHNDLHRYNILFYENKIGFLDFDGIKLYPELLQISSFIAVAVLIDDNSVNIEEILNNWPEKVDISVVKKLIVYRLLYGIAFFDRKKDIEKDDISIRNKYVDALERIILNEKYNN